MESLNSILIEGRISGDVTRNTTEAGNTVTTFTLQHSRFGLDNARQIVSLITVETWGKLALSADIEDGRDIRIVGRLREISAEKEGVTFQTLGVVAEHIEAKPRRTQTVAERAAIEMEG